jgi:hypothetical protein
MSKVCIMHLQETILFIELKTFAVVYLDPPSGGRGHKVDSIDRKRDFLFEKKFTS